VTRPAAREINTLQPTQKRAAKSQKKRFPRRSNNLRAKETTTHKGVIDGISRAFVEKIVHEKESRRTGQTLLKTNNTPPHTKFFFLTNHQHHLPKQNNTTTSI
jgi:hypothetical protein